jgi:hypothetical protein
MTDTVTDTTLTLTDADALELERHLRREAVHHHSFGSIEDERFATRIADTIALALERREPPSTAVQLSAMLFRGADEGEEAYKEHQR